MFDDYSAGLFSGMLIQAADSKNREEKNKKEIKEEQLKAFRLAVDLMQNGNMEILKQCMEDPKDIDYYANFYDVV